MYNSRGGGGIIMVEVWNLVIFSLESLEFIDIEGVRNIEKGWNSMLWNVEEEKKKKKKKLEFQHPLNRGEVVFYLE